MALLLHREHHAFAGTERPPPGLRRMTGQTQERSEDFAFERK